MTIPDYDLQQPACKDVVEAVQVLNGVMHTVHMLDAGVLPNAERQEILERCDAVKKFLAREFVSFDDFARHELGMQCQYASQYVTGICGAPKLAGDLRIIGDPGNYYSLKIHKDDAKIFKSRVEKWRGSAGGKPKCR